MKATNAIAHVNAKLPQLLVSLRHSPSKQEQWLEAIGELHAEVLKGNEVSFDTHVVLPMKGLSDKARVDVSATLLRKAKSAIPGDWYRFNGHHSGRAQLLVTSELGERLVFSNVNGQKVFEFSLDEFAYLLANGTAELLPAKPIAKVIVEKITAQAKEQLVQESEANNRSIKAHAKAKAAEEAARVRQAKLDAEQQQAIDLLKKEKDELLAAKAFLEMEKKVSGMELGEYIFVPFSGEVKPIKLAVRLVSSDKMLFTNERGIERHEFKTNELINKIFAGEISFKAPRVGA